MLPNVDAIVEQISPGQLEQGWGREQGEKENITSRQQIIIRFSVEDNGAGIGRREIWKQQLFKAFSQTSTGAALGGKGSGLGKKSKGESKTY